MTNTARALGLERSHLYKKCQQLGIDLRSVRGGSALALFFFLVTPGRVLSRRGSCFSPSFACTLRGSLLRMF
ncbi:MAG: hypothetical protein ABSG52_01300 [Terriglobales bacterium]